MRTPVIFLQNPCSSHYPKVQVRTVISGKPTYNRDKIKLTCNGYCGGATHNCTDAAVGDALVVTRKGGVERKNSQSPLMNLNLFQGSRQSFSIMQPCDMRGHGFSRTTQNYRSPKFLDSGQWLRNKIRCQVYKGAFPVCEGRGEWEESKLNTLQLNLRNHRQSPALSMCYGS